jgi:hypothetical protein
VIDVAGGDCCFFERCTRLSRACRLDLGSSDSDTAFFAFCVSVRPPVTGCNGGDEILGHILSKHVRIQAPRYKTIQCYT